MVEINMSADKPSALILKLVTYIGIHNGVTFTRLVH